MTVTGLPLSLNEALALAIVTKPSILDADIDPRLGLYISKSGYSTIKKCENACYNTYL